MLDEKGMPDEWQTGVLVPIFKGKGDVRSCNTYRGVKLLEHAMKIVERVLERIRELVNIDSMQFGFMPESGITDALLVVQRSQEDYRDNKKKLYMCFVAFDGVPRKVMEWAIRKKDLPEVIVHARAVMSLYPGAKTEIRIESESSEGFLVQVGVHQEYVLSPLLFAIAVDVILENAREGLTNEILYADNLVLVRESIETVKEKFFKMERDVSKQEAEGEPQENQSDDERFKR